MVVWSGLGEHPGVAKFLGFHARFEISEAWLLSPWEPYGNVMDFVRNRELEVPEKLSLVCLLLRYCFVAIAYKVITSGIRYY